MNKRTNAFLIIITMLLSLMCGCAEATASESNASKAETKTGPWVARQAYAVCEATDSPGSHVYQEYEPWKGRREYHQDPNAPQTVTVVFNGEEIAGEYIKSHILEPYTHDLHKYNCKGVDGEFEIDSITGEFQYILLTDHKYMNGDPLSEDELKKLAEEFVKQYINTEEYTVVERIEDWGSQYTYYKKYGGYLTYDNISVALRKNGTLFMCNSIGLGSFADIPEREIDRDSVEKAIKAKMDEIYAGKKYTYEEYNSFAFVTDDGDVALHYRLSVDWEEFYDASADIVMYSGEMMELVIVPE